MLTGHYAQNPVNERYGDVSPVITRIHGTLPNKKASTIKFKEVDHAPYERDR